MELDLAAVLAALLANAQTQKLEVSTGLVVLAFLVIWLRWQ
jgi:hypothetical protein